MLRSAARTRWGLGRVLACALAIGTATPAAAAAPADDWALERDDSDPTLVGQRMAKLRRNPLDRTQWRALERALGSGGLARRIAAARAKAPGDVALQILSARAALAAGSARVAADTLAPLEGRAGRWEGPAFALRIDALAAAGAHAEAVATLRAKAAGQTGKARAANLQRAVDLAEHGGLFSDAIRIARELSEANPESVAARIRLARLAARGGDRKLSDEAFAAAVATAKARERDEISLEWGRARLDAGDGEGAAALLWSLVSDPKRGASGPRAARWELLLEAHRRAGTTDALVALLQPWVVSHDNEAAAWRTLAQAQDIAGQDSQPSWRRALALDPDDDDAHGALLVNLRDRGDTDTAIAEYQRYVERHRHDYERGLELAGRLLQGPDRARGLALAREIATRVGKRPQALAALLEFYNLGDEHELALAIAGRMVKGAPRSADARIAMGEQLFQMGRVPDALAHWALLPKLVRPAHRGWARHAEILGEHGLVSDAVNSLTAALKLAPDEPNYLRLSAVFAEERRMPQMALQRWQLVREHATAPEHRLLRDEARTRVVELLVDGAWTTRAEKIATAEHEARVAIERGTPLAEAIEAGRFLAELHTRRELYSAAVAVHRGLVNLQPGEPDRLAELAGAQRRAGAPAEAIATLEALLELDPSRRTEALAEISELAFEAGDENRALAIAREASVAAGHGIDALLRLGELHERRGDTDLAAAAYDQAIATGPDDVRGYARLADVEFARGEPRKAKVLLHTALGKHGPDDAMRQVGRRALDLAEAEHDVLPLVSLAVERASKHPASEEPRELVLDALDRASDDALSRWLSAAGSDGNIRALRTPLLAALARGPVGMRARAADQLARLRLPQTAAPLARAATTAAAPRDATPTVRDAYERLRVAALRAAGNQDDVEAIPIFIAVLDDASHTIATRQAALWSLVGRPDAAARGALARELNETNEPTLVSLACVGLGLDPDPSITATTRTRISELARTSRTPEVRHGCAFAEAALARDDEIDSIFAQPHADDATIAAIAAWRRGRLVDPSDRAMAELFAMVLGAGGLARDAAVAALGRHLGAEITADTERPPAPRLRGWTPAFERWLGARLAPRVGHVTRAAVERERAALTAACEALAQGTRAERSALEHAADRCVGSHALGSVCLSPLLDTPVSRVAPNHGESERSPGTTADTARAHAK